jgi:glycosyltransferase 2 family protein
MNRWVRVAISLGLLVLVVGFADWHEVGAVLKTVDLRWAFVAMALSMLDRFVVNYRWLLLLAVRGVHIGFWRLFRVQLAANFLGSFLPSSIGVDAVRIGALCRAGEPPSDVIAATLIDRATIVIATFLLGSLTVVLLAETRIPPPLPHVILGATVLSIAACATCFHPSVRRFAALRLLPFMPERLREVIARTADASLAYRHHRGTLLSITALTLVMFALRILFAKAIVLSCNLDVSLVDLCLVVPLLWIIVMLPITIGGLGVQEAGYVALMAVLGVGPAAAVSMSLVDHVVNRFVALPGALFVDKVVRRGEARAIQPT